jgi:hypothetical protein
MLKPSSMNIGLALLFVAGLTLLMSQSGQSQSPVPGGVGSSSHFARPAIGIGGPPAGSGIPAMPGMPGMSGMGGMGGMGSMGGMVSPTQSQLAEMQLTTQARELLKSYALESKSDTQAELKKSLRQILIAQFDLQHHRRDEELRRIEKRLADLRTKLTKRADAKTTIVDRRLEQLISDIDGLGWGADDLPQDLFDAGAPGAMPGASGAGPAMMPSSSLYSGMRSKLGKSTSPPGTAAQPAAGILATPDAAPAIPRLTPPPVTVPVPAGFPGAEPIPEAGSLSVDPGTDDAQTRKPLEQSGSLSPDLQATSNDVDPSLM